MSEPSPESPTPATRSDPRAVAESAGLHYVTEGMPGITRLPWGRGFTYRDPEGNTIRDRKQRRRFEELAIPPAWTDVWICPDPRGHIQATGRDQRGRKQYRYHPRWREVRDRSKFSRMIVFGLHLPRIRRRVTADLARGDLSRQRVLAAAVRVLDTVPIRVGNERYARDNESYGLTTIRERHVEVEGDVIRIRFRGKGGKHHALGLRDTTLAPVLQACMEMPGAELFRYENGDGQVRSITSDDVNEYLREHGGHDFTAKDFRTWAGTLRFVTVARELGRADDARSRRSKRVQAVRMVAADLNNTPATCRTYYIHPAVVTSYEEGRLLDILESMAASVVETDAVEGLKPEERLVMALLPRLELDELGEEE